MLVALLLTTGFPRTTSRATGGGKAGACSAIDSVWAWATSASVLVGAVAAVEPPTS
ncbi:MAG TPA: hypothetical protein VMA77_06015 [Solirubrobacteraceae bacterium]|nr:hypothetical protein [Solirubrobacteraceae bacterium]